MQTLILSNHGRDGQLRDSKTSMRLRLSRFLSETLRATRASPCCHRISSFRTDRPRGHLAYVHAGSRPRPEPVTGARFRLTGGFCRRRAATPLDRASARLRPASSIQIASAFPRYSIWSELRRPPWLPRGTPRQLYSRSAKDCAAKSARASATGGQKGRPRIPG